MAGGTLHEAMMVFLLANVPPGLVAGGFVLLFLLCLLFSVSYSVRLQRRAVKHADNNVALIDESLQLQREALADQKRIIELLKESIALQKENNRLLNDSARQKWREPL